LRRGADGTVRCWWPGDDPEYVAYHDNEWGRAQLDDRLLFEKVCLEGFQSGLSWLTILRKRENFRRAFAEFEVEAVARFDNVDVERLLSDAGIVRHRGKITAAVGNAPLAQALIAEVGSLAAHFWSFAVADERRGDSAHASGLPSVSPASTALSRDLKKRGWRFVGPTTMYSLMQATGMVNDHLDGCFVREACETERAAALEVLSRAG
jgi:DNA-3-methyladenine glycosylase I